jgi:ribonucleoside-diphosphate reductase alpha chain
MSLQFYLNFTIISYFKNFNISVAVTDEFFRELETSPHAPYICHFEDDLYYLDKDANAHLLPVGVEAPSDAVTARQLWDEIVQNAHRNGEPGLFYIDEANRKNAMLVDPLDTKNPNYIEATNPCAEQPLPPYGCCCLGSINLTLFVRDAFTAKASFDYTAFGKVIDTSVRMLDNVLDAIYAQSREQTPGQRKAARMAAVAEAQNPYGMDFEDLGKEIKRLEKLMRAAAKELEFERAAGLRDRIKGLREQLLTTE